MTPVAVLLVCVALAIFSGMLRFQYSAATVPPILDAMFLASAACAVVSLLWVLSRRAKLWADRETDKAEEVAGIPDGREESD